jgi:hypothetical protein
VYESCVSDAPARMCQTKKSVLIVVGIGSLNNWQKEKQFEALNKKREERFVKVVRVHRYGSSGSMSQNVSLG